MKKTLITLIVIGLTTISAIAQNCNCAITLDSTIDFASGTVYTHAPGDTICLGKGWRNHLQLRDWSGSEGNPIVFINCGGKVEIGNDNFYYGLNFVNCTYFKVTGTGDSNLEYGIELTGTGSGSAFGISGTSSDFEIEYVEISGSDFAGIFCKNDPNCSPSTWRENFVMKNVSIHDTYIHNTGGEGMYIGYSFYTGREITCNSETILVYPHNIENLRIFDNILDSTGWDGIQVGCGTDDIQIFNNKITHYGLAKVGGQTSGIQIGGGTTGLCYNNFIKDGMGNGIAIFGLGGNILYNNVIVNAGRNYYPNDPNQRVYGIFCNDVSTLEGKGFDFINNTIVSPKTDGIRTYSTRSTNNKIYNNIIVNPGAYQIYENDNSSAVGSDAYVYAWEDVDLVMSNNYFDTSLTNVQFANIANDNYALLPTSPAIDGGLNVDIFGILTDFRDSARAYGTAYDIGAYETATTVGVTGCTDINAHNYNAKATISGTCLTCFDGLKNGDETGIDCGGKCSPCTNGCTDSNAHNYNATATTDDGTCETCSDGIQNGDETRVDCGGSCAPCAALDCGCDFVLGNQVVRANGATMGVQGGDRVCIEAGKRPYLRLENFVGDSLNYITFINCGGQAVIGNNFYKFDIQFENSKYFKLTGTGDTNINYGIKLDGTLTDSDLVLTNKSTDFEIEKIEIANADFAGIMCKTDPKCDLSTNRGSFLMQNVKIHDNYIHHTGGEGLYIGHSFYTGYKTTCNGQADTLYPHDIKNIEIYNNIIDHTGWDGMQVGCAVENCKIYNNRITNFATANETYQNVGLVIGGGTSGDCYNNFIQYGSGSGINLFGIGNNKIYNNVIADVDGIGIFADDRATLPNTRFYYLNNTIYNTGSDGIRIYSDETLDNVLINNLIINPQTYLIYQNDATWLTGQDAFIRLNTNVNRTLQNNYFSRWASTAHFTDTLNSDFSLQINSPAIDAGQDLTTYGITSDFDGIPRPFNGIFDIGAYEFHQAPLPVELTFFNGFCKNGQVELSWQTASEQNNSHFEIEINRNGFEKIGSVSGNGTTTDISNYIFIDENKNENQKTLYYRLKQVDFNGNFEYSKTIAVDCWNENSNNDDFQIYPNPVADELTVVKKPVRFEVQIYDVLGHLILLQYFDNQEIITLNLNNLQSGIYFIKIENTTKRFVKK